MLAKAFQRIVRLGPYAGDTFDSSFIGDHLVLSNLNLSLTANAGGGNGANVRSKRNHASGIYFFEAKIVTTPGSEALGIGFVNEAFIIGATSAGQWLGGNSNPVSFGTNSCACYDTGTAYTGAAPTVTFSSFSAGDYVGIYLDTTTRATSVVGWRVNGGNWNNNVANDPATGAITWVNTGSVAYFAVSAADVGAATTLTINTGGTRYMYPKPAAASNW